MERHEIGVVGVGLLGGKFIEYDSDEDEVDSFRQNPDMMVGKAGPEHPRQYAPCDIYQNKGPDILKTELGDINVNSDSCSAVSSNSGDSDDEGKSNRSDSNASSDVGKQ